MVAGRRRARVPPTRRDRDTRTRYVTVGRVLMTVTLLLPSFSWLRCQGVCARDTDMCIARVVGAMGGHSIRD